MFSITILGLELLQIILFLVRISLVLPGGVFERVFVVEGHEEPQDGEEHDGVAGDHQHRGTPMNLKKTLKLFYSQTRL